MLIERNVVTDSISFENLVIQENKFNTFEKAFSIKYKPTIIAPSRDESFYYVGNVVMNRLAFTGFNKTSSYSNTTQAECFVFIDQLMCNNGGREHVAGKACNPSYM